jgi:DNA repair exonuclease SbcCD ATPase subunit
MIMGDSSNIINELKGRIDILENAINELRMQLTKETSEMTELGNQYQALKSMFDMKKLSVNQMTRKLEEKTKILTEARRAYTKIMENTSKLIDAIGNEINNDK